MNRMKFRLDIDCESAAFADPDDAQELEAHYRGEEVARILRKLADELDPVGMLHSTKSLFDTNGNRVGSAVFREEES